jgi:hypothetical protein
VDRSGGSSGGIDEGGSRGTSCSADGSGERGWCSDANGGSSIGNDCSDCSGGSIDGDNGSGDGAGASGGGDLRRHRFIVRPSGTELKLKAYVFAEGSQEEEASEEADRIMGELKSWLSHKKEEIEYNE